MAVREVANVRKRSGDETTFSAEATEEGRMAVREVTSIRKRSGDETTFSAEAAEDALLRDWPTTAILKVNVGRSFAQVASWSRGVALLAAVGSVALMVFAVVRVAGPPGSGERADTGVPSQLSQQRVVVPECDYKREKLCPALALFHDPDVHEVAAENLMKVGHGVVEPGDRDAARAAVAAGFKNISFELQTRSPDVAKELRIVDFTEMQKNAVLNSMRLMSNPKLQSIGRDIGRAMHDATSSDIDELKHRVEAALRPRSEEIMKLRSELIPEPLHELWGEGRQWSMTLYEENIRIMGSYRGEGKYGAVHAGAAAEQLTPALLMTYSILGGVLEEGRALLDVIELCGHLFGKHLPYWVTYLGGNLDVTTEFLSCEHHFNDRNPEELKLKSISSLFCPLKFGTQGMDALKAAYAVDNEGAAKQGLASRPTPPEVTGPVPSRFVHVNV